MVTFCLAYWWSEIITIISFYVLFGIVFKILFPDPLHPMFELQLSRREDKCLAFLRWTIERLQVRKLKRQQETLKSMLHMYTYRGVFLKVQDNVIGKQKTFTSVNLIVDSNYWYDNLYQYRTTQTCEYMCSKSSIMSHARNWRRKNYKKRAIKGFNTFFVLQEVRSVTLLTSINKQGKTQAQPVLTWTHLFPKLTGYWTVF